MARDNDTGCGCSQQLGPLANERMGPDEREARFAGAGEKIDEVVSHPAATFDAQHVATAVAAVQRHCSDV